MVCGMVLEPGVVVVQVERGGRSQGHNIEYCKYIEYSHSASCLVNEYRI